METLEFAEDYYEFLDLGIEQFDFEWFMEVKKVYPDWNMDLDICWVLLGAVNSCLGDVSIKEACKHSAYGDTIADSLHDAYCYYMSRPSAPLLAIPSTKKQTPSVPS